MAAEQLSRSRDNKTKQQTEIHVEKERVPQLASHFEAIAVQGKATDPPITVKPKIAEKTEDRQKSGGIESRKPEDTHELADQVREKREIESDRQENAGEEKIAGRTGEEQSFSKQGVSEQQQEKEERFEEGRNDDWILGAIGETIYEIAETTKEIVIGKQSSLGFEFWVGREGKERSHGYEKYY